MLSSLLFNIIILIAFLAAVAVALYSCLVLWNRYKYRHIPCPKPVSFFLGHSLLIRDAFLHNGHIYDLLGQWAEEYGDVYVIFNFHKPWVFTCNQEGVKEVLVTRNFPKSKEIYRPLGHILGTRFVGSGLVTEINPDRWSRRRHELNPAFHRSSLKELIPEFNTIGNQLVEALGSKADKGNMIELCNWLHRAALGIICKVGYSKDMNVFTSDSPFNDAVTNIMQTMGETLRDPTPMIPFKSGHVKKAFATAVKLVKDTGVQWMEERDAATKNEEYVPSDILNHLMKMKASGAYSHDSELLMDDFMTLYLAGHETTANTVSFMFMEAARHPEVLKKMYEEVDEVVGQKSHISFEDVNKLEYIHLVMKEALRMYPIGPFLFRDSEEGFKVNGKDIPKNTTMMISTYVSQRSPNLMNNPLDFKPERFLPDSPDRPNTYAYFPFSLGPRNCPGQNFANIEARVITAKLLQNFNFELDQTQSFKAIEVVTLRPKDNVRVKISWRNLTT